MEEALQSEPFWAPWSQSISDFAQKVTLEQMYEMNEFVSMCAATPVGMSSTWGHTGGSYFNKAATPVFPGSQKRSKHKKNCDIS